MSYASGRLGQGVVTAGFRPETGVWRADALVQELRLDADLWRSAGPWLTNLPDNWGLSGRIDGQFAVGKTAKAAVPWFQVRGRFTNGRVSGPDGETELHDANGAIYADQQQLRLDSFVGRCKNSQVTASGIRQGWRRDAPLRLSIHAANLDLTRSMIALLPDSMQEQWRTVQALGYLDVRLQLSFSHGQWDSQATLRCRDISLKYELFPYPLQGVHGLVRMSNQRTDINLRRGRRSCRTHRVDVLRAGRRQDELVGGQHRRIGRPNAAVGGGVSRRHAADVVGLASRGQSQRQRPLGRAARWSDEVSH